MTHRREVAWPSDDREWELLQDAAVADAPAGDAPALAGVDGDRMLVLALRQRLLPRLTDYLIRCGALPHLPRDLRRIMVHSLHENRARTAASVAEAAQVVAALGEGGIPVACTKGVVHQATLYGGAGGRMFGDVDLMVHQHDADVVLEVLTSLGYLRNKAHDLGTGELVDRDRAALAVYRLYPDHLPHLYRPVAEQSPPFHVVDVCFDMAWFGSGWRVPMAEVLAEARTVAAGHGRALPALAVEHDFVFTVLHLFRDSWFQRSDTDSGPRLGQFADVRRLGDRLTPAETDRLVRVIERHDLGPPIAWVCHHVDQIFGGALVDGLELRAHCDEAWVRSGGASDGARVTWSGDMRARIRKAVDPPGPAGSPEIGP